MARPDQAAGADAGASAEAIRNHYDLGDDFFGLWLGPERVYSAALFEGDDDLDCRADPQARPPHRRGRRDGSSARPRRRLRLGGDAPPAHARAPASSTPSA